MGDIGFASYDRWNCKFMLLAVVEELQNIITDNDTRFATQHISGAHRCDCSSESDFWSGIRRRYERLLKFWGDGGVSVEIY